MSDVSLVVFNAIMGLAIGLPIGIAIVLIMDHLWLRRFWTGRSLWERMTRP